MIKEVWQRVMTVPLKRAAGVGCHVPIQGGMN